MACLILVNKMLSCNLSINRSGLRFKTCDVLYRKTKQ